HQRTTERFRGIAINDAIKPFGTVKTVPYGALTKVEWYDGGTVKTVPYRTNLHPQGTVKPIPCRCIVTN
ncbi:MAG: hypothetical protein RR709_01805, partial [Ruthenibacterium sp.]